MAMPGTFFPVVTVETFSGKFGLYSTGVRILGSVVGTVLALVLNSAALLALMLAGYWEWVLTLTSLAAVEAYMLVYLIKWIRNAG